MVTPTDQDYKNYSKFTDYLDETIDDTDLIDYSEMWELILLTIFEIVSHNIPEYCQKGDPTTLSRERLDAAMRAKAAHMLISNNNFHACSVNILY